MTFFLYFVKVLVWTELAKDLLFTLDEMIEIAFTIMLHLFLLLPNHMYQIYSALASSFKKLGGDVVLGSMAWNCWEKVDVGVELIILPH